MKKLTLHMACCLLLIFNLLWCEVGWGQNQQSGCPAAQTPIYYSSMPPMPYNNANPIQTAEELYAVLHYYRLQGRTCSSTHVDINFAPNVTIDLTTLNPRAFPLVISANITLAGDYELGLITNNASTGTRIFFPWLYELGYANDVDPGHPQFDCDDKFGSAFLMRDMSVIKKICLYGPRTDTKDWRWGITADKFIDLCEYFKGAWEIPEGINSGIMVKGNKCEVTECEIYGFGHYGVQVMDMVQTERPSANNLTGYVTTTDCFDEAIDIKGTFLFSKNYVHNCKPYGYGYGIWVSAGSGVEPVLPATVSCSTSTSKFYNYVRPEEEAYIHDNIFFDNKHDVASSGNRLSLNIRQNTFSQRSGDYNINMHDCEAHACNLQNEIYTFANGLQTLTATPKFFKVGGSLIQIEDNIFYRGASIDLVYPNINSIVTPASPNYTYFTPQIKINGNYFSTPKITLDANATTLHWAAGSGPFQRDGYSFVHIGDYFLYQYKFFGSGADDHIQVDEGVNPAKDNVCEEVPLPYDSKTPVAVITSNYPDAHAAGMPSTTDAKIIMENDVLWFDTHLCEDKERNQPVQNQTVNVWRMHTQTSDLTDEIRTDKDNANIAFSFMFDKVGINNITLMTMDLTPSVDNEWRGSDLAHQLITVQPLSGRYLTFWIKDTYVGRELMALGNFPGHPALINEKADDGSQPPPPQTATGFEKYVTINGVLLWSDDIEGDEGWQYVKIPIDDDQYNAGDVEIGIRTVGQVDAERVRGVTVYVDDVYINCGAGGNAIYNGDMEEVPHSTDSHQPTSLHAVGWLAGEFDESKNPALVPPIEGVTCDDGGNAGHYPANKDQPYTGVNVNTTEVRSGTWAYELYVKEIENKHWISYPFYKAPFVFKSIKQSYNTQNCNLAWRKGDVDFDVYPTPASGNGKVALLCKNDQGQTKQLQIINMQGAEVYSSRFATARLDFAPVLQPGIYVVKLTDANGSRERKLVITK